MKKNYTSILQAALAFITFFSAQTLFAQTDYWTQKANLPGVARVAGAGFGVEGKGYVGLGYNFSLPQSFFDDMWQYDPVIDTWTQVASFPDGGRSGANGFTVGTKGYIFGGYGNGSVQNDLWEYDPVANSWTEKASCPGPQRDYAVAFGIGNKGYMGTGYDSGSLNYGDFWEYDPVSDSWTSKANVGGLPRSSAVGFSIGSKGYIGAGYIASPVRDFWEYDPVTNAWTQKADVSTIDRADGCGFSIGGYGFICCGYANGQANYDLWQYDPVLNAWSQKSNLSGAMRSNAVAFAIGMKGYVSCGADLTFTAIGDLHEYTPDTTLINSVNSIPEEALFSAWNYYDQRVLNVSVPNGSATHLELIDLAGKCWHSSYVTGTSFRIPAAGLESGIYMIRVTQGNRSQSKKILMP